jgi:hypothetical protein
MVDEGGVPEMAWGRESPRKSRLAVEKNPQGLKPIRIFNVLRHD